MKITLFFIIFSAILITFSSCNGRTETINGSPSEIVSKIEQNITLEATREYVPTNPNSRDILKNYYGLTDMNGIADYCILLPQEKSKYEIAVFSFSDETGKANAENAVKYRSEKVAKMNRKNKSKNEIAVLQYENTVILLITPQKKDEIKTIIDNFT